MNPHVATPAAAALGQAGTSGSAPRAYLNLIGGRWVPASSGRTTENRNPARTSDLIISQGAKEKIEAAGGKVEVIRVRGYRI